MMPQRDYDAWLGEWTRIPEKRRLFIEDIDFRSAADRAAALLPSGELARRASVLGMVLYKPDAMLARMDERISSEIEKHEFRPVLTCTLTLAVAQIRALWRYQFRYATTTRVLLMQEYMRLCPVRLVLYWRDPDDTSVPTSTALSVLKGSSTAAKRSAASLRTMFESTNRMLNWLHVSDEPADLLRELEILLPEDRFDQAITALPTDPQRQADAAQAPSRTREDFLHPGCAADFDRFAGSHPDLETNVRALVHRVRADDPDHLLCLLTWASDKVAFNDVRLRHLVPIGPPSAASWRCEENGR